MTATRQAVLFPDSNNFYTAKPVNVASVPLRSPFRYPGGKTWFVPTFREWMSHTHPKPDMLIEPFAGGGIISLTALFENHVNRVVMVELDEDVAAVWQSVIDGEVQWLADRILSFKLSRESVISELSTPAVEIKERAFQTILKNRTFHGGVLAKGSGLIKSGENGKGIRSRWYPKTLAKRLLNLEKLSSRIDFRSEDGLKVMHDFSDRKDAVFFIDPPYTAGGKKAGKRLYKYCDIDHEELFTICEALRGDFLITYDNADEVKDLARSHGFSMRLIPMKNTHHAEMQELVIGRDLSWMDQLQALINQKLDRKI
ncbi:MAG: DNA adenine methylase [Methanothrix sp.]